MKRLAGRISVIIGATSGIGRCIAETFAREGAHAVVSGRCASRGDAVAQQIGAQGGLASYLPCDVTETGAIDALIDDVVNRFGGIDSLVYCAGGSGPADGTAVSADLNEFTSKFHVDYLGALLSMRAAIPHMMARGSGSIIHMVSAAGFGNILFDRAIYSSAKAAVMNLTRTSARSFAAHGIRINAIAPAGVATERVMAMLRAHPDAAAITARQSLGWIEPQDVAHAAVFLASDESRMITGHVLPLDAGSFSD